MATKICSDESAAGVGLIACGGRGGAGGGGGGRGGGTDGERGTVSGTTLTLSVTLLCVTFHTGTVGEEEVA